jgi:hypothetical protein
MLFCRQLLYSAVPFTCRYPLNTMSIVALEVKYQQLFAILPFLRIHFLLYIKRVQWAFITHALKISTYFYLSFKIFTYLNIFAVDCLCLHSSTIDPLRNKKSHPDFPITRSLLQEIILLAHVIIVCSRAIMPKTACFVNLLWTYFFLRLRINF